MPEPWPDQELLIHLKERNSNRPPHRPEIKARYKGRTSLFKWQEIQMNE